MFHHNSLSLTVNNNLLKVNKMNNKAITSTVLAICATLSLSALTSVSANERKGPRGGKPPAEAIEACSTMSADDSCSFTLSNDEVTGTCKAPPHGEGELACVPSGGRPPKKN